MKKNLIKNNSVQLIDLIYKEDNQQIDLQVNEETLKIIQANFDKVKPLTIICVAGLIGTGKSTWLNIMANLLDNSLD